MTKPARGFDRVEHFFLSGSYPEGAETGAAPPMPTPGPLLGKSVASESGKDPADHVEPDGAVREDSRLGDAPSLDRQAGPHRERFDLARDCIGRTLSRLEILRRSCQGAAFGAGGHSGRAVWFRGTGAIIQEAMATLSEMIHPDSSPEPSVVENGEAEDGT